MKQPIFILSSLLCFAVVSHAVASDYLEEPAPVETPIVEEEITESDNVVLSDDEYITETIDEVAETCTREDELLVPEQSTQILWSGDTFISNGSSVQAVMLAPEKQQTEIPGYSLGGQNYYGDTVYIINNFLYGDGNVSETDESYAKSHMGAKYSGCPFDTVAECKVWLRKPIVSETVAPRSKTLRSGVLYEISEALSTNPNISANHESMAALLNRYQVLMRASQSCCTGGLTYHLQKAGTSQQDVYQFLSDDANFSGFGSRCLVMNDEQIDDTDKYGVTNATVSDVRNECLCKSKESFEALLAPFVHLYQEYPEFAQSPFEYRHYDGVGRAVTDSVNMDVQNVLDQLEMCP